MIREEDLRGDNWHKYVKNGMTKEELLAVLDSYKPNELYELGIMPKDEPKYWIKIPNSENLIRPYKRLYCGVYLIHSKDYVFKYVASSCAIEERWYYAVQYLRENKYHSKLVQQAWNKYGELTYDILEECSRSVLNHVKRKWCRYYEQPISKSANKCNKEIYIPGYVDVYSYDKRKERRMANGWERGKEINDFK